MPLLTDVRMDLLRPSATRHCPYKGTVLLVSAGR
jgi:uncharacterized protein (DUF427 family)